MNRRNFLKLIGVSAAGLSLPAMPKPEYRLGTLKVLPDGRVFRYVCACEDIPGYMLLQYIRPDVVVPSQGHVDCVSIASMSKGDYGWASIKGPAIVRIH